MLRKERRTHERRPRAHIRKVHTGRVGSSSFETVKRTSSTGETSSSGRECRVGVDMAGAKGERVCMCVSGSAAECRREQRFIRRVCWVLVLKKKNKTKQKCFVSFN